MPTKVIDLKIFCREHKIPVLLLVFQIIFGLYMGVKGMAGAYLPVMLTLLTLSFVSYFLTYLAGGNAKIIIWMFILLNIGCIVRTMITVRESDTPGATIFSLCIKLAAAFIIGLTVAFIFYMQKKLAWIYHDITIGIFMLVTVVILLVMLAFGTSLGGAKVNLNLGPIVIQPLEFIKIFYIFISAGLLCKDELEEDCFCLIPGRFGMSRLIVFVIYTLLVMGIFVLLSEYGTMLLIAAIGLSMMFVYGKNRKLVWGVIIVCVAAAAVVVLFAFYLYANEISGSGSIYKIMNRFLYWLDPYLGKKDGELHILNLRKAFTIGGLLGPDTDRYMVSFYAEANDAIFTKLVQSCGILIGIFTILSYTMLLREGYHISSKVRDSYYAGIALATTLLMAFQGMVHIGCNTGLLPLIGLPLMFVSTGGINAIVSVSAALMLVALSSGNIERGLK